MATVTLALRLPNAKVTKKGHNVKDEIHGFIPGRARLYHLDFQFFIATKSHLSQME